jgi:isoleucyl-tRNA synthetase
MDLALVVCSSTLSVRKAHQRRVRLPLQSLTVASPDAERLADFVDLIADEVNVRFVELTTDVGSVASEELKLVPAKLGPRLGKDVQNVIRAHKAGDWTVDGDVVTVGGFVLETGEYSIEQVASDDQASTGLGQHAGVVALDTTVTEELEIEGRARDLIRSIQQARRDADLDVSDRIELSVIAGPAVAEALRVHRDLVASETLATAVRIDEADDEAADAVISVVRTG